MSWRNSLERWRVLAIGQPLSVDDPAACTVAESMFVGESSKTLNMHTHRPLTHVQVIVLADPERVEVQNIALGRDCLCPGGMAPIAYGTRWDPATRLAVTARLRPVQAP